MKQIPDTWLPINPRAYYTVSKAAELVAVDRRTMKRDLTQLQVIPYQTSEKSGRIRVLGKDLIHYRTYVR